MKKVLLKKLLLPGEIIFGLILVLVIVVSVFPLMPPFKNYYHSRTVLTGSMEPRIPKGSVVINQWLDQKNLKIGDVITYQHSADKKIIYITHRIVEIDKTGLLWRFETKGDANPASDFGLVTQAATEGKVIFTIPLIGYLIEFFKTPMGFILLIALPLLIFIVRQIRDVLRLLPKRVIPKKNSKTLTAILIALAFLAARASFVTYASFTSEQMTITGVTLSTASSFGSGPQSGDVVINEVYYQGDSHDEWVELYNAGTASEDLQNWRIYDASGTYDTLTTSSLLLPPDSFAVVVGPNNSGLPIAPGAIKIILSTAAIADNLNDGGDRIILKDAGGNTVDELSYGNNTSVWDPAIPLVTTGHSFARNPKGFDTDQVADFVDLAVPNPGTNPHPPTPSLTPTPTLEPTITATPTQTQEVTPTPTPTPGPEVSSTPTPEPTAEPSLTPTPEEPSPTAEPTPELSITPSPSPEISPTSTPEPSTTPSPEPSPEVSPTSTPSPTSELLTSGIA